MRRAIEEVDLYVPIVCHSPSGKEPHLPRQRNVCIGGEDGGNNCMDEEEWHAFALSETPLTIPPTKKHVGGKEQEVPECSVQRPRNGMPQRQTILHGMCGIEIREPAENRRLAMAKTEARQKGKNKRPLEDETYSDTDSDEAMVVHVLRTSIPESANASRPVARRLVFGIPGIPNTQEGDGSSSSSTEAPLEVADEFGQHWGKFDEALHEMLNDPYTPALFGKDAPPVFNDRRGTSVDTALADIQYEGDDIYVGCVFKSKTDCKIKLVIHAMNRKFHFRTPRSSPAMLLAQCVGIGCMWRVYAVLLDASGNFEVRQANLIHSCTIDERRNYHKLATTQVIGEIMQSRELAMDHAMGTMVGSYSLIPAYLALLQSSNEGTTCFLERYQFTRKVVVVDGTSLKGKFGGCLLTASAQDRNFQVFPLAFAVVDSENDDAWEWFFQKLQNFVYDVLGLVFISDRHASIYSGLRKVYHHAHHVACVVYLWRNIKATFKKSRLANLMSAAARAFTVAEFNQKFIEIQKINPACAAYLVDIDISFQSPAVQHDGLKHCRNLERLRDIGELEFQVQDNAGECFTVLLGPGSCSCMEYDWIGIPCIHALAAATRIGFPYDALVVPPYYVTTWRQGFAGKIYPVPSIGGIEIRSGTPNDLLPPAVCSPPGRPRKVCILSRGEYKEAPHPLGNANVVVVQVTTRCPAVTIYKKYVTMEKAYKSILKLLFGNWVNKRKPLPSTDWPSK
ncbi:hypothetical protein Bca101_049116 [Brassica carinata]